MRKFANKNNKNAVTDEKLARDILYSNSSDLLWKIVRFLLLLSLTFVIVYPLLFMLSMAVRDASDVFDPTVVWIPKNFTFENFILVEEAMEFWKCLKNTGIIAIGGSICSIAVCAFTGYGLARFKVYGKGLFVVMILAMIIVPQQMLAMPNYLLFIDVKIFGISTGINLINNPFLFYILAVVGMGIRSGLFIIIFMQFFRGMPEEIENAALVDGCGFMRIFFSIMLPNATNILIVGFLFSIVWYWNDYYLAAVYMPIVPTLATGLSNINASLTEVIGSSGAYDIYQYANIQQAACLLSVVPMLILYIFTQRYFTESIERSGLVG